MRRLASQLAVAAAVLALAAPPHPARAGTVINPQAGVSGASTSNQASDITESARLGYAFGGNLRLGGLTYFAPGAYYQRTSLKETVRNDVTLTTLTDNVDVHSLYIPVKFGLGLLSPGAGARAFGMRVFAGPSATIITSVKPNKFGLTKDDYHQTTWGAEAGVGVDFATLTFDASYEKGLSNELHGSDAKRNVLRGVFGVKL